MVMICDVAIIRILYSTEYCSWHELLFIVAEVHKIHVVCVKIMHNELHWLDILERIQYKLGVTVHRCLQYKAPEYLVDCCTPVSDIPSRRHLRSATRHSTSPDHTTLLAQHFRSSGLLCCRSNSLELATRQSPAATALDNCWRQIYFIFTTQHTQRRCFMTLHYINPLLTFTLT